MSAQLARQIVSRTATNDSYSWTGHGNGTTSYTTNALNQRARRQSGGLPRTALATVSGAAAAHDARGNMTTDPATGRSYSYWSSDNQLLRVSSPWTVYGYDPLSRLAYIETGTPVTNFAYDGLEALAEYDQNNALQKLYVFGPGIDEPLVEYDSAGNRRYLETDERGSIINLADTSGTSVGINRYDEYGVPAATNQGRFQYTGQMWLSELGLYYYKARMYDPRLGRFLQVDPVGYEGGINLYAYVGNDPANAVDPSGHYECQTIRDCKVAAEGISQIKAARDYYRSSEIGTRIPRSASAAYALDNVLDALGTKGDDGINIRTGDLAGDQSGTFDRTSNTITLDVGHIKETKGRIGETLGHEGQHYRQRNQRASPWGSEVRPLMIQLIIGIVPGGSIRPFPRLSVDYVRDRLFRDYCKVPRPYCVENVNKAIADEAYKPFNMLGSILLLLSCSKIDEAKIVSQIEYRNRECWYNKEGQFDALLVLAVEDQEGFPYFVSSRCIVRSDGMSLGGSMLNSLNVIQIVDQRGKIERFFPYLTITDNVRTDLPPPTSTSGVFLFEAQVSKLPGHPDILIIEDVKKVQKLNAQFSDLLKMSVKERSELR